MKDIPHSLIEALYTGFLGAYGGLAQYIYALQKGRDFRFWGFVFTLVIGFFIGNLIGEFIPSDFEYRDGILMVAGLCSFPIIKRLEDNGLAILDRFVPGQNTK